MNIAVVHGSSFRPTAVTFGPDLSREKLADFYYAYLHGTLDAELMAQSEFADWVRAGQAICNAIWIGGSVRFVWGLVPRHDDTGPFVDFLFALGEVNGRILRKAITQTAKVARAWNVAHGQANGVRVHVNGRPGWVRLLRRTGLTITADGWVEDADPDVFSLKKLGGLH
jgi:hypothetical protein